MLPVSCKIFQLHIDKNLYFFRRSPSRYPSSASQLEPSTDLFDTSNRKEILPRSTGKKTAKFSAFDAKPLTLAGEVDILFGEGGYKSSRRTGGRKVDSSIDSCADLLLFNSTSSPYEAPTMDDEGVSDKSNNLDRMKYGIGSLPTIALVY